MSVEQIRRIGTKLQELTAKLGRLQRENERLQAELVPAKKRELQLLEKVNTLEQQVLVLKANTGKLDEADRKELDKKIHGYLKEIDRCISMLSE